MTELLLVVEAPLEVSPDTDPALDVGVDEETLELSVGTADGGRAESEAKVGETGPMSGDEGSEGIGEKEPRRFGDEGTLLSGSEKRRRSWVLVARRALSASVGMKACSKLQHAR
jgi:hypothetical protein